MIYADNAATTCLDIDAFEAMKPFLLEQFGNASQPYSFSRSARKALTHAREIIAECIGALPEEIYFTSGGTESDNWAIKGTVRNGYTVTSEFEHHAVLNACKSLSSPVAYLRPTRDGFITLAACEKTMPKESGLVSIMMVNNEIGTVQPIHALCSYAHSGGALFHTDAVQAVGHIAIDVNQLGIDMLSASAHKFNGPKGVGFLYVRKGTPLKPFSDGGAQENGMRAGTENIASIVGMSVALKKNIREMEETQQKLRKLEEIITDALSGKGIDYLRNGGEPHIPGNISLSFKNADGEILLHRLDFMGIMVSTGSACDSKNTQISHVLKAIDLDESYSRGTIRISLGRDNTEEDARKITEALIKILQ